MFSFDGNVRWEETAIKEHGFPLRGNETSTTVTFTGAHRTGERACIPTRSPDVHPSRETLTHWRETGGQERDGFGSTSRASTMILVKRDSLRPIILKAGRSTPLSPISLTHVVWKNARNIVISDCIAANSIVSYCDLIKEIKKPIFLPLIILEPLELKRTVRSSRKQCPRLSSESPSLNQIGLRAVVSKWPNR